MHSTISYLWKEPAAPRPFSSAVCLHGHTNQSRESLFFLPQYAARFPLLKRALDFQQNRSPIPVDFDNRFWTPPLPVRAAFELEQNQIEDGLGLASMVSLTDHDSIAAPMQLQVMPVAAQVPISLEWSVPFHGAIFHVGVHNLPSARAHQIVAQLNIFTNAPAERLLRDLLAMLHGYPEVLVILNHPLWDLGGIGPDGHSHALSELLQRFGTFFHGLELNGLRNWKENQAVLKLCEGWNQLPVAGGDRHACEPSACLNLTRASSFPEFVHEVRKERRSDVLFMPQYAEPLGLRIFKSLMDIIRYYPEYPAGSQTWDQRVFHPDANGVHRPLTSLWQKSPVFIEAIFWAMRCFEHAAVQKALRAALATDPREQQLKLSKSEGALS